ncbi:unnamed protein product [Penicillium salamii]|nr:unnamed protein product [Penicillium salamii]
MKVPPVSVLASGYLFDRLLVATLMPFRARLFQGPGIAGNTRTEIIADSRASFLLFSKSSSILFQKFFRIKSFCLFSSFLHICTVASSRPQSAKFNMTSITPARPSLTSNDSAVLQALFDAESSPSSGIKIDSSLPSWPSSLNIPESNRSSLKQRESEIIRKVQGDESPRQENVTSALHEFDELILHNESYPSAYINRAQTLRLLVDLIHNKETGTSEVPNTELKDAALFSPQTSQLCSRIFSDLGQAITLATPASPADAISSAQARLLADAHTHRGYLLLKAARVKKEFPENSREGPERLRGLSADQLEEMASQDFFFGGRYGNKVAQQLAVQTNPYAKMCGSIVKEALRKELEG